MARGDSAGTRQIFFSMPPAAQEEVATQYLMFKLALLEQNHENALHSLTAVSRHVERDPTYLFACVLEAQQLNLRPVAVSALKTLAEVQPLGVHLPSLLRCTARLLISELDVDGTEKPAGEVIEEIVKLFERAAKNTSIFRNGTDEQWRSEIQWWSKNSYNLALRLCGSADAKHLVRLLDSCTRFLDCYPHDHGPMHQDDVRDRRLLCHFLSASAMVVIARSANAGSDECSQAYWQARKYIASFLQLLEERQISQGQRSHSNSALTDLQARKFELLKFDLESVLRLGQWDELEEAVQTLMNLQGVDRWDSLADLIVIVHDHARAAAAASSATAKIPHLLQKCINETWKHNRDLPKMARWFRLTFGMYLQEGDADWARKIVTQAAGVAQKAGGKDIQGVYPFDELCWLASSAFNQAVECVSSGACESAPPWMEAALELARYADDNGSLHAHLTSKSEVLNARINRPHEDGI